MRYILLSRLLATGYCLAGIALSRSFAQEPLETETARLPPKGTLELSALFETQSSSTGRETALPFALEYGLQNRLELLIEPIFNTGIHPRFGRGASGPGDLEATLTYLLRRETRHAPALAFAAEVKVPTARNPLIGTGKTDYAGYVIASKRFGDRLDAHFNLGYTVIGQSLSGVHLNNLFFAAIAANYRLNKRFDIVGEMFGNTAASAEAADSNGSGGGAMTTEVAGGEVVGSLGLRYRVQRNRTLFFAVSRDNNKATLLRAGVTIKL